MKKSIILAVLLLFMTISISCDNEYSSYNVADFDARGTICVTEVHWAGSVDDYGNNSDPDDDFIEVKNYTRAPVDVSGWSIHVQGDYSYVFSFPKGTVLEVDKFYTVGRSIRRAFTYHNFISSKLKLPNTPFTIKVKDGAGTTSDTVDFHGKSYIPAGMSLPLIRKSAIRHAEFFGPEPGDLDYNWMTFGAKTTSAYVRSAYNESVFCSPGSTETGEGFNNSL